MEKTRPRLSVADDPSDAQRFGVAIIGVGSVGRSLARSLALAGYRVAALIHRSTESVREIGTETNAQVISPRVGDIPQTVRLVFICTHESDYQTVIDDLLESAISLQNTVVAHVSGRESAAVLAPLQEQGAMVLSFHPLGSFVRSAPDKIFRGLTVGLEGSVTATEIGRRVAKDLGAYPVEIPTDLKSAYYLSAVMTSNFLCTLMGDVEELLRRAGLPFTLTHSLARDTLDNLAELPAQQALTGPIVRGDVQALKAHVVTVKEIAPDILETFVALAQANINLARKGDRITSAQADEMRIILAKAHES